LGGLGEAWPAGVGGHVVDAVAALLEDGLHAGAFVKFVLNGVQSCHQVVGRGDGPQGLAFPQ
jgi:hypothetical protein